MEKHIKNIKNKNKIKIHTSNTIEREKFNKLMNHASENQTEITADSNSIKDIYNNTALENFKNSSDYEEMWNIAIDKWTRNWNFYRVHLTNSILEKFQLNNKRQKRQTKEDYIRRVLSLPLLGYFRNCLMVVSRIRCTLKAYLTN